MKVGEPVKMRAWENVWHDVYDNADPDVWLRVKRYVRSRIRVRVWDRVSESVQRAINEGR